MPGYKATCTVWVEVLKDTKSNRFYYYGSTYTCHMYMYVCVHTVFPRIETAPLILTALRLGITNIRLYALPLGSMVFPGSP